ncbi:MAG TPA: UrcA family protein [Steroidobacteraceae bacterium]
MTNFKFNDLWHGSMLAALTACMAVGLVDVARSATPGEPASVKVSYGDLNLASAQGAQTLHARISAAARQVCAPDGFDIRDLKLYTVERSCMVETVATAESKVPGLKVASVTVARR